MKNLDEMLNEALAEINESKIDYTLQLCQEDGTVEETTSISFDNSLGKSMEDFYDNMSHDDFRKLEKEAHKILIDAHKKNRDIVKICIVYEPDGGSETLDEI